MRPTAIRQSALRAPLNVLLGTEANVRLLRILTQTEEPVSASQLAREAGLSGPGAYQALQGLDSAGIIIWLGRGSRGQLRLRKEHPLAAALVSLFDAERRRVDLLFEDLKTAVKRLSPPPRSVWLYGPVAEQTDTLRNPLNLAVIAGTKEVADVTDKLIDELANLEARHDVGIEVRGLTEPDLQTIPVSEQAAISKSVVVAGLPPEAYFNRAPADRRRKGDRFRSHEDHDRYLLRLADAIAKKLKADPTLIDRAARYIRRRAAVASPGERKELHEWERLLRTTPPHRLRAFLVDRGPRATRLRQTLPFLDVVSKQERAEILSGLGE